MEKSKLLVIVGVVLITIALVLSAVSVIMMSSVLKKIGATTSETEAVAEGEAEVVPISETVPFDFTEPMIATLPSHENSNKVVNLSIEIGFRLKEGKKTEAMKEHLTENQNVLRDRISKILDTKTMEDYQAHEFKETFQKEILEMAKTELETDLIVEVYFGNTLESFN
ncbi:MAG: flagellar basal body-associated FliL family protein [Vallitaleaceae bacterium]|nr:flagellar basal body-associated FliL family protein [Vallitaleaceae bacterium]